MIGTWLEQVPTPVSPRTPDSNVIPAAVISSARNPVYAKQKLFLLMWRRLFPPCLLSLIFLLASPFSTNADSLEDAGRALARRAAPRLAGKSIICLHQNLSSMAEAEFEGVANAFDSELQQHDVKVSSQAADASVRLTISRNSTALVGIVEVKIGEDSRTFIEPIRDVTGIGLRIPSNTLRLRSEFLIDRDQPVLDIASQDNFEHAQVLGANDLSYYAKKDGRWRLDEIQRLPIAEVTIRLPAGSLEPGVDEFKARLAGQVCSSAMPALDKAKWSCQKDPEAGSESRVKSKSIWNKKTPPWTSVTQLPVGDQQIYAIAGRDGMLRLYEDGPEPVASFSGWGNELTSIRSSCDRGWLLLVTGSGDWTANDKVTAVEIKDRKLVQTTNLLEVPGPIVMLRSSFNMPNPTEAVAVVRNLQTGRYEFYGLSINCVE
jgi:hypothetical protein